MNIPGFTAEASLGKTRDRYILASGTQLESVLPQLAVVGTDLPVARIVCVGGHCYLTWTDMTGNVHGVPLS
jgi:hypothetical protein